MQVEIAARAALGRRAFARRADAHAVAHAGRNPHFHRAVAAVGADHHPARRAFERVFEGEIDRIVQILASAHPPRSAGPGARATPAEKRVEEAREGIVFALAAPAEDLLHLLRRHRAVAGAAGRGSLFVGAPIGAEVIVFLSLLGITQDLVGLVHVLELGFGGLVAGIEVGMVLPRQLAVGAFDLVGGRGLRDPKRGVVVLEFHQRL